MKTWKLYTFKVASLSRYLLLRSNFRESLANFTEQTVDSPGDDLGRTAAVVWSQILI